MKKADEVYEQLVRLCQYIKDKQAQGWLLLNNQGNVVTKTIVFSSHFSDKCIAFWNEGTSWATIVEYGSTRTFGSKTLLQEYKTALKYMQDNYKLFEPKQIHSLKSIKLTS